MGLINYYAIEQGIQAVLEADSALSGTSYFIEEETLFDNDKCPAIFIYLERRDAPIDMQRIAAGTTTDMQMRFSLWCLEFHMEGIGKACQLRDDLMGKAEVALMKDRTLNATIGGKAWLEGGRFITGEQGDGGFIAAGEIILVGDSRSTTA